MRKILNRVTNFTSSSASASSPRLAPSVVGGNNRLVMPPVPSHRLIVDAVQKFSHSNFFCWHRLLDTAENVGVNQKYSTSRPVAALSLTATRRPASSSLFRASVSERSLLCSPLTIDQGRSTPHRLLRPQRYQLALQYQRPRRVPRRQSMGGSFLGSLRPLSSTSLCPS